MFTVLFTFLVILTEKYNFTHAEENATNLYDSFTTAFYINWFSTLPTNNETIEMTSSLLLKTDAPVSYPEIALERRLMMNWDKNALERRYQQSAGNKSLFLMILREEFRKTKMILNRQKNGDSKSEPKTPNYYLKRQGRILVSSLPTLLIYNWKTSLKPTGTTLFDKLFNKFTSKIIKKTFFKK